MPCRRPVRRDLTLCHRFASVNLAVAGTLSPVHDKAGSAEGTETGQMSKRDELIEKYAGDLRDKCGVEPDMDLLTKVVIGLGPSIYNADSETVAATQESELETVKNNFLVGKLGLADGPELMEAIGSVVETYGKSERNKYRAVVYYLLTKHFGKEGVYA
jgi:hypothetical protein